MMSHIMIGEEWTSHGTSYLSGLRDVQELDWEPLTLQIPGSSLEGM